MADKEKRLRKILVKMDMRGMLRHAKTLEESHIVLVDCPEDPTKYAIYKKEGYQQVLANGYTFPEDRVHFLVHANPRNRRQLEQSLMTNRYGAVHMSVK